MAELDVPDLAAALRRAERIAPQAIGVESVVCHGDFHPLSVVIGDRTAAVVDWTDAALGPREADVARTLLKFNMAAVATDRRVERFALRVAAPRLEKRCRRAYESARRLDPTLLGRWEVLHAVHGWARIEMLHAGGFEGESSADAAGVPAAVSELLRGRIERTLSLLGD